MISIRFDALPDVVTEVATVDEAVELVRLVAAQERPPARPAKPRAAQSPKTWRAWTAAEDAKLLDMLAHAVPVRTVAKRLKRTFYAVSNRRSHLHMLQREAALSATTPHGALKP